AEKDSVTLPPLVVVGARWSGVATEGQPPADWLYLGRQPDAVLVYLFRRALALVFPSKYEGFGLPVAEAMALGCPVICSPVASLPEVGGKAAFWSELNRQGYLVRMRELLGNQSVSSSAIASGRQQAAQFPGDMC